MNERREMVIRTPALLVDDEIRDAVLRPDARGGEINMVRVTLTNCDLRPLYATATASMTSCDFVNCEFPQFDDFEFVKLGERLADGTRLIEDAMYSRPVSRRSFWRRSKQR